MNKIIGLIVLGLSLSFIPVSYASDDKKTSMLWINAMNDIPGPVDIVVRATNHKGKKTMDDVTMTWAGNNNIFSTKGLAIPNKTRILRFTFINDQYGGPGDNDRNAFIDYFTLNHNRYEAEDFDRTGGPDVAFPGCEKNTLPARTVAGCGNEGDYAEYDLLKINNDDHGYKKDRD